MMRSYRRLAVVTIAAMAGCGGPSDGLKHRAVFGEVTLDGRPLDDGTIVFVPIGFEGPPAGGAIRAGSFAIPAGEGPVPGPHSVSVYAKVPTGRTFPDPNDAGAVIRESFESIPPRYNAKTELRIDVTEGGPGRFDFKLADGIKSPSPAPQGRR